MNQKQPKFKSGYGDYDYDWYQGGAFDTSPKYKKHVEITSTNIILGEDNSTVFKTVADARDALQPMTIELCQKILCLTRASKSVNQQSFAIWLQNEITKVVKCERDEYGNLFTVIKQAGIPVSSMFTSHIDTCHKPGDPPTQTIYYDHDQQILFKDDTMCMGADDGVGVYIMLRMIRDQVPGLYTFFRDEEIGRLGSRAMAKTIAPETFNGVKRCISFDRAGASDIIKSQSPGVCCSNEFVAALSKELASLDPSVKYAAAPGSYTDSASFMTIIPECTNLSVGYKNQHGPSETQCVKTFKRVVADYPLVEWDKLPTLRDPKVAPPPKMVAFGGTTAPPPKTTPLKQKQSVEAAMETFLSSIDGDLIELMELVESQPRLVAFALASDGYTALDLFDLIDRSSQDLTEMFGDC